MRSAVLLLAVVAGCGGDPAAAPSAASASAGAAATVGSGGSAGSGGTAFVGAGTGGVSLPLPCPRLDAAGQSLDAGPTPSAQAFCDGAANPASCPVASPPPGDACAASDAGCAYSFDGATYDLVTCDGAWLHASRACHEPCDPPPPDAQPIDASACATAEQVACDASGWATDQERANAVLQQLGACCLAGETQATVWLSDGCPVAVASSPDVAACFATLLAGRRFACASKLGCVTAGWSTLP